MTQTKLFKNNNELIKYYRTQIKKMSMDELQSYKLASFQITEGKTKKYIHYCIKDTPDGLMCEKKVSWYALVPNHSPVARKDKIFTYMNDEQRKKYKKHDQLKVMDLDKAFIEIEKLRKKTSPTHRIGVRIY